MKKKLLSLFLSAAMMCSVLPATAVNAAEDDETDTSATKILTIGKEVYREDFEKDQDTLRNEMYGGEMGWTVTDEAKTDGGRTGQIDAGGWLNTGSNAIRFVSNDWEGNQNLTLDFEASSNAKNYNTAAVLETLGDNPVLSFDFGYQVDYSVDDSGSFRNMINGSRNMVELLNSDGRPFMALEAYTKDKDGDDVTLNLIALNAEGTENVRYELAKGKYNVLKQTTDDGSSVIQTAKVYVNSAENTYRLELDGEAVEVNGNTWIKATTSSDIGAAAAATSLVPAKLQVTNIKSNWFGGALLDNISIAGYNELAYTGKSTAPDKAMTMWYRMPATRWAESLPLGNGRIGAMVWGGVLNDTLSLSEVTVWSGEDHVDKNLDADNTTEAGKVIIEQLQNELKKDSPNRTTIANLLQAMGGESNPAFGTNRPFGKLTFEFDGVDGDITDYRRALDIEDAISTVEFTAGGTKYTREALTSNVDQVIALKYTADKNGEISFDVNFATEDTKGGTGTVTAYDGYVEWDGAVYNDSNVTNGVNTFGYMAVDADGGNVTYDADGVHVIGADEAVLYVSIGTDFTAGVNFDQNSKENCKSQLDSAMAKGYADVKADHIADVNALYNRMNVEIGPKAELKSDEPTDVRVKKIREGAEIDGSFTSLWYQYARYLMIAGSRENSPLPMNLLGIWNDNVAANMAWTCDYHLDINTQMNQWMANSANLSEGELPLFKWMKNIVIPNGKITAQKQYNSSGWLVGAMTNAWGYTGISASTWESLTDTTCGAWLAQEIMSYYDYTGDKEFLANDGFGMLKDTAAFYNDFMTQYTDENGNTYWVIIPSGSPEHGYAEMMTTMDNVVIRDIFTQTMRCYDILGVDKDDFYNQISDKLNNMPPLTVDESGSLDEWAYSKIENNEGNTNHRHTSHLLGLYPYAQITQDKTPELAHAALVSMQRRYDRSDFEHTEWTAVNGQTQYARLKDGENAYKYLKLEADTFTWPNLLSVSPEGIALAPCDVYCIDGTLGIAAGIAEMLLQSHSDRIEFLPALPKQWSEGNIEGMGAAGAFEVDFAWEDYTIKSAKILSKSGNTASIVKNASINWTDMAVYKLDADGNVAEEVALTDNGNTYSFLTEANTEYLVASKSKTDNKPNDLQTGRLVNNSDPRIKYTDFIYNNDRGGKVDYMGDIHYGEKTSSTIEFTFTGTGIDVLTESDGSGKAFDVYIDGEKHGSGNSKTDGNVERYMAYSVEGLEYGSHTIKVAQTEEGGYLCFDAFMIHGQYAQFVNDDDARITYSDGWTNAENRYPDNVNYMNDVHYSDNGVKNATATITFTGTGIEVLAERGGANGNINIVLDGADMGTVSAASEGGQYHNSIWQISGLSNGTHTLTITNLGEGGWGWLILDGFVILNEGGVSFNTGTYQITNAADGSILDADGEALIMKSGNGGASSQKWIVSYVDEDKFRLISAYNGKAISIDNGSAVMKEVDRNDNSQLFTIIPYSGDPSLSLIMNCEYGQYLQINGGEGWYTVGSVGIYSYEYWVKKHFIWEMKDEGDGLVSIKNSEGEGYFTIEPNTVDSDGAKIYSYSKAADDRQKWNIESTADGYFTITSLRNGMKVADNNGTVLVNSDGDNTKWSLEAGKLNGVAYYTFTNAQTGNVLTLDGSTQWALAMSNSSKTVPYVYAIKASGSFSDGNDINVSYEYNSFVNSAETNTEWAAYVVDSAADTLSNPIAEGTATAADGFKFSLSGYDSDKTIAIKITPVSADGVGAEYVKYILPKTTVEDMVGTAEITEDFNAEDAGFIVSSGRNGWYSGGEQYTLGVADKANHPRSMYMTANNWWSSAYAGIKLNDATNSYSPITGKGYLEFDANFDAPSNNDKDSSMYITLKNDSSKLMTLRLTGKKLDLVAMSSNGTYTRAYNITTDTAESFGQWFNFKFFIDTEANRIAVKVNDEYMKADDGTIWFIPANDAGNLTNTTEATINAVTDIEFGHYWMSSGANLWIDNVKMGTYAPKEPGSWSVDYVTAENDTLVYGETSTINLGIYENAPAENGVAYTALYSGDKLLAVQKVDDITFDARGMFETSFELAVPKIGGEVTMKVFLWDNNMAPIGDVYETTFNVDSPFEIPNVFSDNMMLQADAPVTVWGIADVGEEVTAIITDTETGESNEATATVEADGTWSAVLPAYECGGNYTLTVKCAEEAKTYKNIIFGDVYVLAGQSNMEYWMAWGNSDANEYLNSAEGIAEMTTTNIRTINMNNRGDGPDEPSDNLTEGSNGAVEWQEMSQGTGWTNSAIGYFFARDILKETNRPVGFISTAVGGTGIKRWIAHNEDSVDRWESDLYNGRIYPLRNLEISGILWYQGEAEGDPNYENSFMNEEEYSDVFAELIDDWRELFGRSDLPFIYAQLARYEGIGDYGLVRDFKELRAAQYYTLSKVAEPKNVMIVSNIDAVGNFGSESDTSGTARVDIHPSGKIIVANRFAKQALKNIYGMDIAANGPMYKSKEIKGNTIELTFDCTGDLAIMDAGQYADYKTQEAVTSGEFDPEVLNGFEIAGADGVYVKAAAIIDSNKVILTAEGVSEPKNARYTYEAFPESPNLTDESGLPSYTFSTEYAD